MRRVDSIRIAVSAAILIFIITLPIQAPILERVINPLNGPLSTPIAIYSQETLEIPGLENQVKIYFDEYGVPYIHGESYIDIAYALGYLHARDRLFQMDVLRRLAYGRLSELVGEAALDLDKRFRQINLRMGASSTLSYIRGNPEFHREYAVLEAYTWGVNAFINWSVSTGNLPPEYILLDQKPKYWRDIDSVIIGKFMAWSLSWSMEDLYLADIVDRYGLKILFDLDILNRSLNTPILESYTISNPVTSLPVYEPPNYNTSGIYTLFSIVEEVRSLIGVGSNNWVVSPSLTEDGRAYVANDPHLSLTAPPIWYVAGAVYGDYRLFGFTLPGTPVFLLGTNGYVAWGFTNVGADVTDYYYFKWEGDRYLYKGEFRKLDVFYDPIYVAVNGEGEYRTVDFYLNITVLGPLIEHGGTRYAVRWTGYTGTLELVAVLRYGEARSIDDLIDAAQYFHVAAQNLVAADREGNILYLPAGRYPVRNATVLAGDGVAVVNTGFLPFNASRGEGIWLEYIPYEHIPRAVNPMEGYVATANNKIVGEYPYYLGWSWSDRYRYARIVELIEELKPLDKEDMFRIQTDRVSKAAEIFTELFGEILRPEELPSEYRRYYEDLLRWSHEMDTELREPGLYTLTLIKLHYKLWSDVLGDAPINLFSAEWTEMVLKQYIDGRGPALDYIGGDVKTLLREAFIEAVDKLMELYGEVPRWGEVIRYEIKHLIGDVIPWFNYNVYPGQGGLFTVFVSGHGFGDPPYSISASQSMRAIYILGGGGVEVYYALPGGNSGIPSSPHYQDLLPIYVSDEYVVPTWPMDEPDIILVEGEPWNG